MLLLSFVHYFVAIQTWVTANKCPIWVKIDDFLEPCDLEIWRMTLRNDRAPFLSNIKLCASFHHHYEFKLELQLGGVALQKKFDGGVRLRFSIGYPWPGLGSNTYLYLNTQISVFVFVFVFESTQDEIFVFVFVFDWRIWVYLTNIFQIHFSFLHFNT